MMPSIEYIKARSIEEAVTLLGDKSIQTRILAGGTDVIPGIRQESKRFSGIRRLVDISGINVMKSINRDGDFIQIGAAASFSEIENNALIKTHLPVLCSAVATIGSRQIRNRATIGGNFVNNAPCADSVPALLVYGAEIVIRSAAGERRVELGAFLKKPYTTLLNPGELVSAVIIPVPATEVKGIFYKLGRRRGVAISRITIALLASIKDNRFQDFRIASGAVTPIGMRFPEIEAQALNQNIDDTLFKHLARTLGEQVLDVTGLRWSTPHKLPVLQQVLYQLLNTLTESGEIPS